MSNAAPADRRDRTLAIAFAVAVVCNLAPVLWFAFLPTRDGPAHAFTSDLMRALALGRAGPAADVVGWNPTPVPNWAGHAVMALGGAVVGPFAAERLAVALIGVLLPLGLRYAIRAFTTAPTGLEFLALPLAWGAHLHWGFYSFLLSLSLYLFSIGYWFRHRHALEGARLAAWSVLLVLTYLAGVQALLHAMAFVVVVTVFLERVAWRQIARRSAAACLPAVALFAWFVLLRPHVPEPPTAYPSTRWAAASLFRLDILRGVDDSDRVVTAATAALLGVLAAWTWLRRPRRARPTSAWAFAALVSLDLLMLFVAPTSAGGGTLLTPRQAVFTALMLLLCLAADPGRLPSPLTIAALGIAAACALHAARWPFYTRYDEAMRDFIATVPSVLDGRTLYAAPLECDHPGPDPRSPVPCLSGHAGAYVAMAQHAVLVNDYELQTAHFPLIARQPASDGTVWWAGGRPIESVLLWRGSIDDRRQLARRLLADRPIACEIQSGRLVPATLFLASCPSRP